MSPEFQTLPAIFVGIAVGGIALLAVGNELGRRGGLSLFGRVALGCALGFGVIAFTLKAGIILYLDGLSRDDLVVERVAEARSWQSRAKMADLGRDSIDGEGNWVAWQALPAVPPVPHDNPQTAEKIALGRALFFDPALSADGTISCASCHKLDEGGDDNSPVSTGIGGLTGDRNAPSVVNAAFLTRFFWDGRAASLEAQAKQPLLNPVEMAMPSHGAVVARIAEDPAYVEAFNRVFAGPEPLSIDNAVRAIAAFERTLVATSSAYDRYVRGDADALSPQQLRGMALFAEVGCRTCHVDPTFSSAGATKPFGIYRVFPVYPENDFVRRYDLLVDGRPGLWRVPSLRNVARTAPYFHNGSVATLEEAIRTMAVSQLHKVLSDDPADDVTITSSPAGEDGDSRRLSVIRNRALSSGEIADIAAFLESLSADPPAERYAAGRSPPHYARRSVAAR